MAGKETKVRDGKTVRTVRERRPGSEALGKSNGASEADGVRGALLSTLLASCWEKASYEGCESFKQLITRVNLAHSAYATRAERGKLTIKPGSLRECLETFLFYVTEGRVEVRVGDLPRETVEEVRVALPLPPRGGDGRRSRPGNALPRNQRELAKGRQ